jgi:hypothetical protein
MCNWREKADEFFPDLAEELSWTDSPMSLWVALYTEFVIAYEEPRDESLIRRVYEFAEWCMEQEQPGVKDASQHLLTCVAVCFWEPLPTNRLARADMPRWFTYEDIALNRRIFSYFLSDTEFEELLTLFPKQRRREGNSRKRAKRSGNQHR